MHSAASAAAGNMMARSLFAAVWYVNRNSLISILADHYSPLFDRQMFQTLGIEWGCTLLGCLALIMIPFPLVFIRYGPKLRQRSVWAPSPLATTPVTKTNAKEEV